jgi:succinate dehydrogenase/fumarate reductase flavoprotein subunit
VSITILEKEARSGGNSRLASSGMNALGAPGSGDSPEAFFADTVTSGGKLSVEGLVRVLVVRAACRLQSATSCPPRTRWAHSLTD